MKMIACDYDGTIKRNETIDPKDLEAIKLFRSLGHLFVICTGRSISSVLDQLKKYDIPFDYIIGVNGSIACDQDEKIIYKKHIPQATVAEIHALMASHNILSYHVSDGLNFEYVEGSGLPQVANDVCGYYIQTKDEETALSLAGLMQSDHIKAYVNLNYVAIGSKGIHKGYGAQHLADMIHFKGQIYAIGDDYNDIPMFKKFESYGIASGYVDAVKYAKNSAESVRDAISHILR